ncbi:short-chain dehydrogenase [Fusarium longipes]|uniref:Short-chain dehydrogenase n=1 Tax=Fusarium longipes TaxID=694270 RepID=A0A395SH73_9HYPO|nr:short-chain dehydrogenase [Fusarium longipes]
MAFSFAAAGASSITLMGQYEESLRKTTAEVKAKYPSVKILYEAVDITNRDQVEPAMERIVSLVGDLSILVCNGGDMPQLEDSIRVTPEQFHYAIDIATWGCINMVQSFKPRSTNGAIIINVSAAFTHTRSLHDMSVRYFSRLANFMEHLATENSDLHIVNMHPGVVQRLVNSNDQGAPRIDLDDPSLPADFTVWLASPEAAFLKGEIVWANWDVDELISRKSMKVKDCHDENEPLNGEPIG